MAVRSNYKTILGSMTGSCMAIYFLVYFRLCPKLDILFGMTRFGIHLSSFWIVIRAVTLSRLVNLENTFLQDRKDAAKMNEKILTSVFAAVSVWRVAALLPVIRMAIMGTPRARYVVQSVECGETEVMKTIGIDASTKIERPLDELGLISISALLVFYNCKYHLAPTPVHQLIIGPDVMKSVRLNDYLLLRDWMRLVLTGIIMALSLLILPEPIVMCFLFVNVSIQFTYMVITQATRLFALRRYEVQAHFQEMVKVWDSADCAPKQKQPEVMHVEVPEFLSLTDDRLSLILYGFFSSPGELLPPTI